MSISKNITSFKNILIILLFLLLTSLIIIFTTTFLLFLLLQQGLLQILNPNKIYLPQGQELYYLKSYTFRNESLHRYDERYIVMDEAEKFEILTGFVKVNEEFEDARLDDVLVMNAIHYDEGKEYGVGLTGICECYEEREVGEDGGERKYGSLVFSKRYSGLVVISVLSFAVAKFVNDHIDDCYHAATDALVNIEDSSSSNPFVCIFSEISKDDEYMEMEHDRMEKREEELAWYMCNGYCLNGGLSTHYRKIPEAREASEKFNCEDKQTKLTCISVNKELDSYINAKEKYVQEYLSPFCKSVTTTFIKGEDIFGPMPRHIRPCLARSSYGKAWKFDNVECYDLKTFEEILGPECEVYDLNDGDVFDKYVWSEQNKK